MKEKIKPSNIYKLPVKNFAVIKSSSNENYLPEDLIEAIEDVKLKRNLHGPFDTAEDAVKSMLED